MPAYCVKCDYDLSDAPAVGQCPSCGNGYFRPQGVGVKSVARPRCSDCGYSLEGLGEQGQCPECGQAFDTERNIGVASGSAKRGLDGRSMLGYSIILCCVLLSGSALLCAGASTNQARMFAIASVFILLLVLISLSQMVTIYQRSRNK